jgi:mannose-6-phosphate isomerase-like protein (cupin superfamily)
MSYAVNIEEKTKQNNYFRQVLFTAPHSQLVVMSLKINEDIGEEVHNVDQFIRIEEGDGKAVLDGVEQELHDNWAVVIPAGTKHNIINTGEKEMKLYTIYSPAHHQDGTLHLTKYEAMKAEE